MLRLLAFSCLLALATCQTPRPCQAPMSWEAKIFREAMEDKKETDDFMRMAYDELNQRIRVVDEVFVGQNKPVTYEYFFFHLLNLEYRVNLATRNCTVHPLSRPFRPFQIPPDAKYRGSFYIGGSVVGEGVQVTMWNGTDRDDGGKYFKVWTEVGCLPVDDHYESRSGDSFRYHFFDITLGIHDPDIFDLPPECRRADAYQYVPRLNQYIPVYNKH